MKKPMLFQYGEAEIAFLSERDEKLAAAMDEIGLIECEILPDLFAGIVQSIVGQQISMKAQATIWQRMLDGIGAITPAAVAAMTDEEIQRFGISFRKAGYIKSAAQRVLAGALDLDALHAMPDEAVCRELCTLSGVGRWTAEMLLIFSMRRPDVLSHGDLAIHRGLRMLYRHRAITDKLFHKYRRRYSPYATVASLYLWQIAGGAVLHLRDLAGKGK